MGQSLILGVPPIILDLHQQGLLERAFHDALMPALLFRAEAMQEEWAANSGDELIMTRPGLLTPVVTPIAAGTDPQPRVVIYEQWKCVLGQYADAIDTNMPTSATAMANLFMRNIQQLGLGAGMSIDRIARNSLFKAYLAGNTTLIDAATASVSTTLHVSSLNGFRETAPVGVKALPYPVSSTNPLSAVLGASTLETVSIVNASPDNPNDPDGPGVLTLSAAVSNNFAARQPLISAYAARIVRPSGGRSVDSISASDTFVLQAAINAVAFLRQNNVQPHEDGFYHAHISPTLNAQVFADPVFQRLNQSLPEHVTYKEGFIGTISGVMFFMNSQSPDRYNTGTLVSTGSGSSKYATEIGAEVVNHAGINIGRVILTGRGALYERYLNEDAFLSEAGVTGKIGDFAIVNNGIQVMTDKIRLIIRSPMDRLQQMVSAAWSISTAFAVPSDILAPSGSERFKRAVVIECAS